MTGKKNRGGLLGKPGTISRKLNLGCLIFLVPFLCLAVWSARQQLRTMEIHKSQIRVTQALNRVFTGCTAFWETHPGGICTLPGTDEALKQWGLRRDDQTLVIADGSKTNFMATARCEDPDRLFRMDHLGTIYQQVGDCLLEDRLEFLTMSDRAFREECARQAAEKESL